MSALTVANTAVRQDEYGRYCLNDLHRAAGGHRRDGPALWLENQGTQALITEVMLEPDAGNPVSVVRGGPSTSARYLPSRWSPTSFRCSRAESRIQPKP